MKKIHRNMNDHNLQGDKPQSQRNYLRFLSFPNKVGGQAVLGRQNILPTPWLTERHGYDPTFQKFLGYAMKNLFTFEENSS